MEKWAIYVEREREKDGASEAGKGDDQSDNYDDNDDDDDDDDDDGILRSREDVIVTALGSMEWKLM